MIARPAELPLDRITYISPVISRPHDAASRNLRVDLDRHIVATARAVTEPLYMTDHVKCYSHNFGTTAGRAGGFL